MKSLSSEYKWAISKEKEGDTNEESGASPKIKKKKEDIGTSWLIYVSCVAG